jgi:hypothetical protein
MMKESKRMKKVLLELKKHLRKYWGKRCPDYFPSCGVCDIWHAYDVIEEGVKLGLEE